MPHVLVYRPAQTVSRVELPNGEDVFTVAQRIVEGYLQHINMGDGTFLLCDEDGLLKGLPANRTVVDGFGRVWEIVGTFVLVAQLDGEFAPLTDEDSDPFAVN